MITFPALGQAGRLGNQLWQIASTIGIARSRGEDVCFPDWDYRPYFSLPDEFFSGDPEAGTDASTLVPHIAPSAAIYLQDYNLFKDMAAEIREYLTPSDQAFDKVGEHPWMVELLSSYTVVAVHVRRGDNAYDPGTPDKHLYHPLRSASYYSAAIDVFPTDVEVMVFSDDIPWCRENMDSILGRRCYFFEGGSVRHKEHEPEYKTAVFTDWVDLAAMTLAPLHIISNSTYAWWGAFISGDPSPVYPTNWFGPKLSHIDTSLMFPDYWIPVQDPTEKGI
jgi:hypothetical protein